MKSAFNTRIRRSYVWMVLSCWLAACSSSRPAEEVSVPVAQEQPVPVRKEAHDGDILRRQSPASLTMTYQNQGSTLRVALDPYDENLHIEMKRTPDQRVAVETAVRPPAVPAQKDTVVIIQKAEGVENSKASAPIAELDSARRAEAKLDTLKWGEITDEVLTDIRKAQDYFYKQDYHAALRLVKSAQAKRPTAEGYALQGSILYMLGDKGAARHHWSEALNLNPHMPEVIEALRKLEGSR